MNLSHAIRTTDAENQINGAAETDSAIVAFALVGKTGAVALDPNNLAAGAVAQGIPAKTASLSVPSTGFTVTANANSYDELIALNPAGTLAAGTFVFPSDAQSRIGQVEELISSHIVTALTVTSTNLTLLGTAVTALAANTIVKWVKVAAATWQRTA